MSEISSNGSVLETTVYSYDADGSLISENDGDVTSYAYDIWGNMTSAGGATYAYNIAGLPTAVAQLRGSLYPFYC